MLFKIKIQTKNKNLKITIDKEIELVYTKHAGAEIWQPTKITE